MIQTLVSNPYAGHTFIQWICSYMLQLQLLFAHFLPHKIRNGNIGWTPKAYRSHVRELRNLMLWFINHAARGCPSGQLCA